ncbi:hypothetical protein PR048_028557 [Dryococelus australis]|uniref:Uncharacterized protein n=1 Tax=Dryococelus australis TaxID=614101 RepID=A0ABQ9GES6_9NEOP|nr:hypothetical protein PR048_028557 [Dryococelus australis]
MPLTTRASHSGSTKTSILASAPVFIPLSIPSSSLSLHLPRDETSTPHILVISAPSTINTFLFLQRAKVPTNGNRAAPVKADPWSPCNLQHTQARRASPATRVHAFMLASQKQSIRTYKTPYDQVKWCRGHKTNIEESERINVDIQTALYPTQPNPFFSIACGTFFWSGTSAKDRAQNDDVKFAHVASPGIRHHWSDAEDDDTLSLFQWSKLDVNSHVCHLSLAISNAAKHGTKDYMLKSYVPVKFSIIRFFKNRRYRGIVESSLTSLLETLSPFNLHTPSLPKPLPYITTKEEQPPHKSKSHVLNLSNHNLTASEESILQTASPPPPKSLTVLPL